MNEAPVYATRAEELLWRSRSDELLWGNASLKLEEKVAQLKEQNPVVADLFRENAARLGLVDSKGFIRRKDAVRLIVSLTCGDDIEFRRIPTLQGWHFGLLFDRRNGRLFSYKGGEEPCL